MRKRLIFHIPVGKIAKKQSEGVRITLKTESSLFINSQF